MGIPAKQLAKNNFNIDRSFTAYGTPTDIDLKKLLKRRKKTI